MADDKERRSRMANSSVNAPAKKGGAGGHNWGAVGDVKDFEPVGSSSQGAKVTTGPADGGAAAREAAAAAPAPSPEALGVALDSEAQFPALQGVQQRQAPPRAAGAWRGAAASPPPGVLAGALRRYDAALRAAPLRTKLLTAAASNAASELLSYRLAGVPGGPAALLRQCAIGAALTGLVHKWYALIEEAFASWPSSAVRTIAAKTALQMTILEPVLVAIYIAAKRTLSGQRGVLPAIRAQVAKLTVAAWSVWGPAAVVQYRFVPVDYRNFVSNVLNLAYTVYLITTTTPERPGSVP